MFDHVGIFVSDPEKIYPFYEACLAPLGIRVTERQPWGSVIFQQEGNAAFWWVGPAEDEYYGTPLSKEVRRPTHFAFRAPSREAVDAFHRAGLEAGGIDNGAPEEVPGRCYHAFLLDADGNNIEAIFRDTL
jgi:catechol 2,3-dioxygenase-like lactoylglutathione lyase family enzyme